MYSYIVLYSLQSPCIAAVETRKSTTYAQFLNWMYCTVLYCCAESAPVPAPLSFSASAAATSQSQYPVPAPLPVTTRIMLPNSGGNHPSQLIVGHGVPVPPVLATAAAAAAAHQSQEQYRVRTATATADAEQLHHLKHVRVPASPV